MKLLNLITICAMCVLTQTYCKRSKPLFKEIPKHELFINRNIDWKDFNEIPDYRKKLGGNENDTMIILTNDKMILITGQYGMLLNDTIIIPTSGEFGINYEVLENKKHRLFTDTLISFGQQQFVREKKATFQWWDEILPKIKGLGKGSVIVSGP